MAEDTQEEKIKKIQIFVINNSNQMIELSNTNNQDVSTYEVYLLIKLLSYFTKDNMMVNYTDIFEDLNTIVANKLKNSNDYVITLTTEPIFGSISMCFGIHNNDKFRSKHIYKISRFTEIVDILVSIGILNNDTREYLLSIGPINYIHDFIYSNRLYRYNNGDLIFNIFRYFYREANPRCYVERDEEAPECFMCAIFNAYEYIYRNIKNKKVNNISTKISLLKDCIKYILRVELGYDEHSLTDFISNINIDTEENNIPLMLYKVFTMYYLYISAIYCSGEDKGVIKIGEYYDKGLDKYIMKISVEEFNDLFDGKADQLLKLPGIKEVRILENTDTDKKEG